MTDYLPKGGALEANADAPAAFNRESRVSSFQLYESRFPALLADARRDVDEFLATGQVTRAKELSIATGQQFCDDRPPGYFTGDLEAALVLVHLNPKASGTPSSEELDVHSFEEWFSRSSDFGRRMYGAGASRRHRSPFDHKQVRFLEPFGVIDFVDELSRADRFTNLERVIDLKLQMELIPYGSNTFETRGFTPSVLQPHIERLLATVVAVPRQYVLFCGSIFERMLGGYITRSHEFHLRKNDGTLERQTSRFANLRIPYEGGAVVAGLAQSWARMGIPMRSYGEEVRSRYGE